MRARGRYFAAVALACMSLAAAPPAGGQETSPCPPTATIEACFSGFLAAQTSGAVSELAAEATTGPQVTAPETETAIRDFLPRIAAALITPGLQGDQEALSFRFNQGLGFATAQLGVELHKPVLHGPLSDTLAEDARATLAGGLDDEDDVTFTFALNLENRTIGRRFGPHRNELSDALRQLLPQPNNTLELALEQIEDLVPFIANAVDPEQARRDPNCRASNAADRPLSCFRGTFADSLRGALRQGASALGALREARREALENLGIAAFAQLLGNQPQLNVMFGYRTRADVVGPDEWTGSFRFEWGFRDLNWLRRRCGGAFTAGCLAAELNNESTRDAIGRAERLVAEVEVVHRPEHDIHLVDPALTLLAEPSTEVQGSVAYGRYFGDLANGTRRPRVDASVSFEYHLEGAGRNDRLLAQFSYTHPVSDNLAGVFGLALANKPEFIGDDARRLFGTLGVTYKLVGEQEK